jgi:hypothetical protein
MRAGYVLHSRECLECGVVGQCCSNMQRSLRAYGVSLKAVRTCACAKNDTARVCSSGCAIPYTQASARSYTPTGACTPTYQIQARVHAMDETTRERSSQRAIPCSSLTHTRSYTLTEARRSAAAHEGILLECVLFCTPPTAV